MVLLRYCGTHVKKENGVVNLTGWRLKHDNALII